jgi:16S rRNA (cytidine1402-2'-O)-methyltransferase
MSQLGRLYVIATPIGHPKDITLRALELLQSVDAVICEERRKGSKLLKKLNLQTDELIPLNEHNELENAEEIAIRIVQHNQTMALISDAGTPVFADPGSFLIKNLIELGVQVVPIPGPSSIMAALSVLDFKPDHFMYEGFLPRDPIKRRGRLKYLRSLRIPIILMDTPYRLGAVLDDVAKVFGANKKATLACDLTQHTETILRGEVGDILAQIKGRKAEFVLIMHA